MAKRFTFWIVFLEENSSKRIHFWRNFKGKGPQLCFEKNGSQFDPPPAAKYKEPCYGTGYLGL